MIIDSMLGGDGKPLRANDIHDMPAEYHGMLQAYWREAHRVYEQAGPIKSGVANYAIVAGIQGAVAYLDAQADKPPACAIPIEVLYPHIREAYERGQEMFVLMERGIVHVGRVCGYHNSTRLNQMTAFRFQLLLSKDESRIDLPGHKVLAFRVADEVS